MNLFWCKANVKHFGFNNLHYDFDITLSDSNSYLLSYCHFGKINNKIHSYMTSNMDDFKTICKYKNLTTSAYFFKKTGGFFLSLKGPTFSNIIQRAKHVLNTFKLRTLYTHLYLFHYRHFICSSYLNKHSSLCEQFSWYQSPDEGY